MDSRLKAAALGAAVKAVLTAGIYFDPGEPYPHFVMAASVLDGVVLGLLVSAFVDRTTTLARSLSSGVGLGFLLGASVYLAKGGWVTGDAPFVVPVDMVAGGVLAATVRRWTH